MAGESVNSAHFPVFIDLRERRCVVVGGGRVGERKVKGLLEGGADSVEVVAPDATARVEAWHEDGRINWNRKNYEDGDLEGAVLAFAATDDPRVNGAVVAEARRRGILANAADRHTGGDFIGASTLRRGSLQIAISSGGGSPAYVRMLREHLDASLGPEHEVLVAFLQKLRPRVHDRFPDDIQKRKAVWDRLVSADVLELVRAGQWKRIDEMVEQCLS